jgi:hypothetical protein
MNLFFLKAELRRGKGVRYRLSKSQGEFKQPLLGDPARG